MSEKPEYSSVKFIKVNVDEAPDVKTQAGVSAMPTFVSYRQGQLVERVVGWNPPKVEGLVQALAKK
jgi:thioredoxin 1